MNVSVLSGVVEVSTNGLHDIVFTVWDLLKCILLVSSGLFWQIISVENENVFDFEVRVDTDYQMT